jgi:glutamate N-acetyltransferase/amino-acid N-acetyltransferase
MTTDTRAKEIALSVRLTGGTVTIGGMAKGAGMISPDMATMLALLTTDAAVSGATLQATFRPAVESSFNRITVDGDTSTNDTALVLANGASGVAASTPEDIAAFGAALAHACTLLAQMIVRDGEGASRFVTLRVSGALHEAAAVAVCRTIATSPLVKTAIAGGDPNWGRVLAAAGRAGVALEQDRLALWVGIGATADLQLVSNGTTCPYDEREAVAIFGADEIAIRLDLGMGDASATIWTCDLTKDYVAINGNYRS